MPTTPVAIERVFGEDVESAVARALNRIRAHELMSKKGMVVLIKPNLLMAKPPERAATTHPAVLRGVIQWVSRFEPAKIYVADSSNGISPGNTRKAMRASGIEKVCEDTGAVAVPFEETPRKVFRVPDPLVLDEVVSSTLLEEADIVINVPKIKTHGQCVLTCCIKNMFGTVILGNKSRIHARFPSVDSFSSALADVYSVVRPQLTVIDGYLCQEGRGPSSGDVVKLDAVIAGYDPVALDTVVCRVIGLDPKRVAHIAKAAEKGLGTMDLEKVSIHGVGIEGVRRPFKIPLTASVPFRVPQPISDSIAKRLFQAAVSFDERLCVRCGTCWQNCPTGALSPPAGAKRGRAPVPVWSKKACIACYCCAETCPHEAVRFKIDILRNIMTSWVGPSLVACVAGAAWLIRHLL